MARQKEREAAKRPSSYPANQAQFHEATKLRAAYYRAGNRVNRRSRTVWPPVPKLAIGQDGNVPLKDVFLGGMVLLE